MNKDPKIFVARHEGTIGASLVKRLKIDDFNSIITKSFEQLSLTE